MDIFKNKLTELYQNHETAISKIIELFTEQLRKNCTFNNEEPEVLNLAVNGVTLLNYRHKKIPINEFYTSFNPLEDTYQIILAGGYWANDRNEIGISWQIPCFKGMTVAKMHEKQIEAQLKEMRAKKLQKEEGYKTVNLIKPLVKKTYNKNVLTELGQFGALYELGKYNNPVLVSGTDGVGTKIKIALEVNKLDTIGIDCLPLTSTHSLYFYLSLVELIMFLLISTFRF